MKHLLFAGLFLSAVTCRSNMHSGAAVQDSTSFKQDTTAKMQDTSTIEGRWQLQPVMASDTAAGKIPYIIFDLKTNRFSGNTGCNSMSGNFVIKQDALQFNENVISTKMACPGYNEKPFFDNLLKTNRYTIKNGVLQLMYNATILSKWVRHSDTTITKQI